VLKIGRSRIEWRKNVPGSIEPATSQVECYMQPDASADDG
jgi:hypothetical protein